MDSNNLSPDQLIRGISYFVTPAVKFDFCNILLSRGVQYVHWVMHKCIMVKVGGKRNTQKARKKQVNLSKTGGTFLKVGGEIIILAKQGGNVPKQGGNSKFVVDD